MTNVVQLFPGAGNAVPKTEVSETPEVQTDVRQEVHTESQPVQPQELKPPVYVRVHAGLFQEMLNALAFYAGQGWDQGKKAREIINEVYKPEPPAA